MGLIALSKRGSKKTMKITQHSMCSFAAVLALLLIAGTTASAQTVYGSIVGNVADATGSAIPNANVKLTNLGTNESRTAQTDNGGNYTFRQPVAWQLRDRDRKRGF